MAISLKVNMRSIGNTKTMRFVGEMSISEVAKEIREKVPNAGGNDHSIFQPGTVTQKPRWLRVEKTLRFYDLQSGVTITLDPPYPPNLFIPLLLQMEIEYKKKHRQLKVRLLDETVRTFLIDESATVAALTEHVGYKMGIKSPEEFSFKVTRYSCSC
jgi:talin